MNTYPTTIPQWIGTGINPRFGVRPRIASNGKVRLRALQSAPKYDTAVVHGICTQAERNTIVQFYIDNRTLPFLFTATEDGTQRTMVFAETPYKSQPVDGGFYNLTVYMLEA